MSWTDNIQQDLVITTGDGKQYKPLWLNAQKGMEFNIAVFNFPNIDGTLIRRSKAKGRVFPIEIYFTGDDHLTTAKAFEKSSLDIRAWKINHPFYDNIIAHPAGLNFDNTQYNVSKITGILFETIVEDNPKTTIDPVDNILIDKGNVDSSFTNAFTETPSSSDINNLNANNSTQYKKSKGIIKIPAEAENYFNLFNKANAAVTNAIAQPLLAIQATQALITAPAQFSNSVQNRVQQLSSNFSVLGNNITGITDKSSKQIYENNGGTLISSEALAAATPQDGDYSNRTDVLNIIQFILGDYNTYLNNLDSLQSENGGTPESYIPDANSLILLNDLINSTVSNLFTIALSAKSERSLLLEQDSNWIVLTHRFYSLDPFDNNLSLLMAQNNVGLNEILQVKKGRKIIYYI